MSTFYLVLYIFLAIIALLCIISFIMYMLHVCGKEKDYDEEQFFSPRQAEQASAATDKLNSTETTQFMDDSVVVGGGGEKVQLLNVKRRTELYEQNIEHEQQAPAAPRPVSMQKPVLPVKPNFTSTTQSPRNSTVLKPVSKPPPPPPQVEVAVVHPATTGVQKTLSIKKPMAPPPPPPSHAAAGDENLYENMHKRHAPPPPTYIDVMKDIPVDNYLSDND